MQFFLIVYCQKLYLKEIVSLQSKAIYLTHDNITE